MTIDEARELILQHGLCHPGFEDPKSQTGFLAMLRPYRGLVQENFDEVMTALKALAPSLRTAATFDRDLISALWGICTFGRLWGCDPKGMLRRNGLINERDVERLADWLDRIAWAVAMLLNGADDAAAFRGP